MATITRAFVVLAFVLVISLRHVVTGLYVPPSIQSQGDAWRQPTPVVQTNSGKVVGVVEQGYDNKPIYAFKGIPYAADPSGSNRWLPPQDPESWSDVRDTSTWGNVCPQEDFEKGWEGLANVTGADLSSTCFLSWTPRTSLLRHFTNSFPLRVLH